jgi:hypothetical protein
VVLLGSRRSWSLVTVFTEKKNKEVSVQFYDFGLDDGASDMVWPSSIHPASAVFRANFIHEKKKLVTGQTPTKQAGGRRNYNS